MAPQRKRSPGTVGQAVKGHKPMAYHEDEAKLYLISLQRQILQTAWNRRPGRKKGKGACPIRPLTTPLPYLFFHIQFPRRPSTWSLNSWRQCTRLLKRGVENPKSRQIEVSIRTPNVTVLSRNKFPVIHAIRAERTPPASRLSVLHAACLEDKSSTFLSSRRCCA